MSYEISFDFTNKHKHLKGISETILKSVDSYSTTVEGLQRQDLEGDMERLNLLETPFYKKLDKVQATARRHEYRVVTSRHDRIGYSYYADGSLPRRVVPQVAPRYVTPTLMGRRVTYTELSEAVTENGVKPIGQFLKEETITALMEETEFGLFWGDRSFGIEDNLESPTNLQNDGMVNIIKRGAPQNIFDAKGKPLTLNMLWDAEQLVYNTQALAKPTTVFLSPINKLQLMSEFYQIARTNKAERIEGLLGADAQSYISAFGEAELVTSRFVGGQIFGFNPMAFGNPSGEDAAPDPLTSVTAALAPVVGYSKGLDNGVKYTFAVKPCSFFGEARATFSGAVTTANGSSKAVLTLNGISQITKFFKVWVKEGDDGKYKFLGQFPYYGAETTLEWDGHELIEHPNGKFRFKKMAGTGVVLGVDMGTTNLCQWLPLEQVPLPQALTKDYVIRHVTTLFSRAQEFNFMIVNVGQDPLVAQN